MLTAPEEAAQPRGAWRLPEALPAWYLAMPSRNLRVGQVRGIRLPGGRPVALYRTVQGVHALHGHCAHMGGNLAHGQVVNGRLRCPLHHWEFDGQGRCQAAPAAFGVVRSCVPGYPTAETCGSVLVFNGREPGYAPPPHLGEFNWHGGAPVLVRAPWYSLIANPFDVMHIQTIHQRQLLEEPSLRQLNEYCMQMRCRWRVTGTGLSDRVMRWLSRDCIEVEFTCYGGPLLLIRSDLGRARSALLVGLHPQGEDCVVQLVFGSRGGALAARLCQWLYTAFLRRDLAVLEGARFHPYTGRPCDGPLGHFAHFLESLVPPGS